MAKLEIFVVEFFTVDWFAPGSVAVREIPALGHELGDNSMKNWIFISELFSANPAFSFVPGAKSRKIGHSFRDNISKQTNYNSLL